MDVNTELLISGFKKGLSAFFWMIKIVIPVSYLTALTDWFGLLEKISIIFSPFMYHIGLPSIAAIPIIAGALSSVYAGVATMSVLPFSKEQMILMANFILICHNMIQETIIQANSGIRAYKAICVRLLAAIITVYFLKLLLIREPGKVETMGTIIKNQMSLYQMHISWFISTVSLIAKIFAIIMFIMVFLEVAKAKKWTEYVCKLLSPFLRLMGLTEKVSFLWMTAVVFGLAYGGAVIVEEAKDESLSKEELEALQLSVGINHSMVEDPALFLPLGLPPVYLWVPRIITAMVGTRLLYIFFKMKKGKKRT